MFAATGVTSGRDAARREAFRRRCDDPFDGDAQQVRHRALHRGAPQLRAEDLVRRPEPPLDRIAVLGVGTQPERRRWMWRAGEDRIGLGIAQRLGVPEIVGRLLAARGVGIEARGGLPGTDVARAAARPVGADRHGCRGRAPGRRGAARRDGRRVRRLRRGRRVQRRADGRRCCARWAAPCCTTCRTA